VNKTAPQFMFDCRSPNAFLSHRGDPRQSKQRTGVKVEYVPVLLGGIFRPPTTGPPPKRWSAIKQQARVSLRSRPKGLSGASG